MSRVMLFVLLLLCSSIYGIAQELPGRPSHHINDYGNVLSKTAVAGLEKHFANFEARTGHEALVATFKNVRKEELKSLARRLFDQWKPGTAGRDDGILLVIALTESHPEIQIEVGHGLRDKLSEGLASQIVREEMVPFLEQGQVATAILAFVRRLDGLFITNVVLVAPEPAPSSSPTLWVGILFFSGLLALFAFKFLFRRNQAYTRTIDSRGVHRIRRNCSYVIWGRGSLNKNEESRLARLISSIEQQTGVDVRIQVSKAKSSRGTTNEALSVFRRLNLDGKPDKKAVLIFINVSEKDVAFVGNNLANEAAGKSWSLITNTLRESFHKGDYYLGLHNAIETLGQLLNPLPSQVADQVLNVSEDQSP